MHRALLLCALLVLVPLTATAPVAAASSTTSPASLADDADCGTTVRHDDFRQDDATVNATQNGSTTSTQSNTDVTVDTNVAFARVEAENPNGYCVNYIVEISPKVIDPADLGTIDSVEDDNTATWRAIHDFDADETYTKVEFTVGSGENVTFAPSQYRVKALKWTGEAKDTSSGFRSYIDSLPVIGGGDDLEQRTYTIAPEGGSDTVSLSLANESTGGEVESYQALYRTDDGGWTPVGSDSSDPVFKNELEDENVVEFHFNDRDAEVEFTANPNRRERASYQWKTYWSGVDSVRDLIPGVGGMVAPLLGALPLAAEVSRT